MRSLTALLALLLVGGLIGAPSAHGGDERPPSGRKLRDLVERYLEADFATRARMRREADATYAPLSASKAEKLAKDMLKAARKVGPKAPTSRTTDFLGEDRGKVLVSGKPTKVLFLGLHGGGEGSGSAESAQGSMGGGGWWWLYPEVIEKTERGWTDSGTEEFVVQLVEAAKRTGKVDPDRIYIAGHSMGGFGAWTIGAHHADLFGGIGAFAGAPIPIWRSPSDKTVIGIESGVLPNLFALRLHVYQSGDDQNVPPAPNDFAMKTLEEEWKPRFSDGFDFRYDRVEGRGHAAPSEGYLPSLKWLVERPRNPRPKAFLWQPALGWKRQFYWVRWDRPEIGALLEVRAKDGNACEITVHEGAEDLTGLSVLVGAPLFDLDEEVVVRVNGEERFRGEVGRTLSTLLMTLPRYDAGLLFAARVDL